MIPGPTASCSCYLTDSLLPCVSDKNSCEHFTQANLNLLYFGDTCISDRSSCSNFDPSNNASTLGFDFKCKCNSELFSGAYCEKVTNLCESNTCSNGGTCIKTLNSKCCLCPAGYSGNNCENAPIDSTTQLISSSTPTTAQYSTFIQTTTFILPTTTTNFAETSIASTILALNSTSTSIETTTQPISTLIPTTVQETTFNQASSLVYTTIQSIVQTTSLDTTLNPTSTPNPAQTSPIQSSTPSIAHDSTSNQASSLVYTTVQSSSASTPSISQTTAQDTTLSKTTTADTSIASTISTLNPTSTSNSAQTITKQSLTQSITTISFSTAGVTTLTSFLAAKIVNSSLTASFRETTETSALTTQPKLDCSANPCQYDGICANMSNSSIGYECECTPFYTGVNCEKEEDDCSPDVLRCENNANCVNYVGVGNYGCDCAKKFEGKNCDIYISPCLIYQPCRNKGVCYEKSQLAQSQIAQINNQSSSEFVCKCVEGFYGAYCEKEVDICLGLKCENGGACVSFSALNDSAGNGSEFYHAYKCLCTSYFYGSFCEKMVLSYKIKRIVSTSFGAAAAIAIISLYLFIIVLDLSKLFCKYDRVVVRRGHYRIMKRKKKEKPVNYVV